MSSNNQHLVLVGPTASGKSELALEIARRKHDIELVSIDSMQVYVGMDVGTAKPTVEQQAEVPHHLIDIAKPNEDFGLSLFQQAAREVIFDIEARSKRALLVGGTGLYVRAVVDDLQVPPQFPDIRDELETESDTLVLFEKLRQVDPIGAQRMEPTNHRRVIRALEVSLGSGRPFSSFGAGLTTYGSTRFGQIGVWLPRNLVNARISNRFHKMLDDGLVAECTKLLAEHDLSPTAMQALGYKEIIEHLEGDCSLEEATELAITRTQSFARRQRVWFRRDPRIHWYGGARNSFELLPAVMRDWL